MKKYQDFGLHTTTDLKVFLLFLLDNIRSPIDEESLLYIVEENTDDITLDYTACLIELVASGHLYFDEIDNIKYYMISEKGRMVARELKSDILPSILDRSLSAALRYLNFKKRGIRTRCSVEKTDGDRYLVTCSFIEGETCIFTQSLVVDTMDRAQRMQNNFYERPEAIYRGVLALMAGNVNYLFD